MRKCSTYWVIRNGATAVWALSQKECASGLELHRLYCINLRVLFLDEPASGLDPEGQWEIGNLIVRLNHEFGLTIFMNTHQSLRSRQVVHQHWHNEPRPIWSWQTNSKKFWKHSRTRLQLEEIYLNIEVKAKRFWQNQRFSREVYHDQRQNYCP